MSWTKRGCKVVGNYYGHKYSGIVEEGRVCYGGDIEYRVKLDKMINVFGEWRTVILVKKMADFEKYKFVDA